VDEFNALFEIPSDVETHDAFSITEKWILSRSAATAAAVQSGIENYRFNEAAGAVYQFVWHEFCDWYLEAAKPALYEKEGEARRLAARSVLARVLKDILVMLHPFMPFVTEEIWHALPMTKGAIMAARYPTDGRDGQCFSAPEVEREMGFIFDLISAVRNIRGEMNIQPSLQLDITLYAPDEKERKLIQENASLIQNLSRVEHLDLTDTDTVPPSSATSVVGGATLYVSLEGVIDFEKEVQRLEKEIGRVTKELVSVSKRLSNESFLDKAPEDVVEKVKSQQQLFQEKSDTLTANLKRIQAMQG
jgi:valyl-tRNA synthetase